MGDENLNRVVRIPLLVPGNRVNDLYATRFNTAYCQQQTSDYCWDNPKQPDDLVTNNEDAENALYHPLRKDTNQLHANLTQQAIKDVTGNMKTCRQNWDAGDRVNKPMYDICREDDPMR
ncbi:hypothetical protein ACFQE1_03255 [Halobium palmae]|uniref:Uncharacterized protein n=1 Tax=Halobium palmae TaxID=1776492 RepID=A0ABD5RW17_9EURY